MSKQIMGWEVELACAKRGLKERTAYRKYLGKTHSQAMKMALREEKRAQNRLFRAEKVAATWKRSA